MVRQMIAVMMIPFMRHSFDGCIERPPQAVTLATADSDVGLIVLLAINIGDTKDH